MRAEVFGDLYQFSVAGLGAASHHRIDNGGPLITRPPSAHDDVRAVTGRSANFVCDIPAGAFAAMADPVVPRHWALERAWFPRKVPAEPARSRSSDAHDPLKRFHGENGTSAPLHQSKWFWLVFAAFNRHGFGWFSPHYHPRPEKGQAGHRALRLLLPSLPPLSFGTNDRLTIGLGKPMSIRHILC